MHMIFSPEDYEVSEFRNGIHERIIVRPMYYTLGLSPSDKIYGRAVVLKKITQALQKLPEELGFIVWDVYRPRSVQKKIFDWMREEIRKNKPHLTEEENFNETKKYAALPSAPGDNYCSPHLSGGAIDLTLFNINSQEELDMGTPFDDCTEKAHSQYFNTLSNPSEEEKIIKARRNLLREAMTQSGFTPYHYEWWHYDIGNLFWSKTLNTSAVFGPLFGDDEWPQ